VLKAADHVEAMKRLSNSPSAPDACSNIDEVSDEELLEAVDDLLTGSLKSFLAFLGALMLCLTPAMLIIHSRTPAGTDPVNIAFAQERDGMQGTALAIDNVTLLAVRLTDLPSGYVPSTPTPAVLDNEVRRSLYDASTYVGGIFACGDFTFTDPHFPSPIRGGSAGAAFIVERAAQILGPPPMTVAATGTLLEDGLIGSVGAVSHKVEAARATHQTSMSNVTLVLIPVGQGPTASQMDGLIGTDDGIKVVEVDSAESVIAAVWGRQATSWSQCPDRPM